MTTVPVTRALISVSDKTGLAGFAKRLTAAGVEIVSSGGTAAFLDEHDIAVTRVEDVTGAAEMLGGRVKTLHPAIHGAILANLGSAEHRAHLQERNIEPIQLVVVNLYPFTETVANDPSDEAAIEQIDIGGPAMIRAAAKNQAWVSVVISPNDYDEVAAAVETGGLPGELRSELARRAFFHTAAYDAAIVAWLDREDDLPQRLVIPLVRESSLRYGENPHQAAAVYAEPGGKGWWARARQLQGKEMSFNNYVDAEAAWRLATELEEPSAVVVKHTNPSGVALRAAAADAFTAAWECDPVSAFGGVVALNGELDEAVAAAIADKFIEVVVARAVSDEAAAVLAGKKNLRVVIAGPPGLTGPDLRRIEGGLLVQARDTIGSDEDWTVPTDRQPTAAELVDLRFAWTVAAHTKSNAIVIAGERTAYGVGAGDQSRVGAAERALARAGERAAGAVAASDAFFPFRDGIDVLAAAGVSAVVEPGGSRRDDEVIGACDEHDMALVFTGMRHFRH
jgi:phosphoribosylaminoimidazolecarboxamide formyltransferase/IMP cyclohydrolase